MMHAARLLGMLYLVLAAGCAGIEPAPAGVTAQSSPAILAPAAAPSSQALIVAAEPPRSQAKPDAKLELAPREPPHETLAPREPVAPREPLAIGGEAPVTEPAAAVPAAHAGSEGDARAAASPAKTAAKIPAVPAVVPGVIAHAPADAAPAPAAKALEQPLDVAALKLRLRNTKAIGVFAKLALSNQVDDLLQQFRAHYLSGENASVASLRQPFDMLILKVLALIQDSDPSLAKTISGSREAIWGILADPVKFDAAS
jgi:hypothetical protein